MTTQRIHLIGRRIRARRGRRRSCSQPRARHGLMIENSHRAHDRRHRSHHLPHQRARRGLGPGRLPAGDAMAGPGNIAVPDAHRNDARSRHQDARQVRDRGKTRERGCEISYAVGAQSSGSSGEVLEEGSAAGAQSHRSGASGTPALSPAEFAKTKQQFIGSLQQSLQNTALRAQEAFARAVFPDGHPNHPHAIDEYLGAAKAATLEEVKAFHAKYYGPKAFTLVLVGDVDGRGERSGDRQGFSPAGAAARTTCVPRRVLRARRARASISVPLKSEAEHLGHLGAGDGPALPRSGCARAAGRHGDSRPGLHGSPHGHGARPRRAHLSNRRRDERRTASPTANG